MIDTESASQRVLRRQLALDPHGLARPGNPEVVCSSIVLSALRRELLGPGWLGTDRQEWIVSGAGIVSRPAPRIRRRTYGRTGAKLLQIDTFWSVSKTAARRFNACGWLTCA